MIKNISHLASGIGLLPQSVFSLGTGALWHNIRNNEKEQDIPFIHLQWFAPEDEGRTEDPTEHKIKKAREEGKVAKSSELAPALVLIFSVILIAFLSKYMFNTLITMLKYFFSISSEMDITSNNNMAPIFFTFFLKMFLPVAIIALIASLAGNIMQVGFLFSTKPITPDFNKISPNFAKYFQRAFFSAEAVFNLGKTLFKIFAIGVIVFLNLKFETEKLLSLGKMTLQFSLKYILTVAFKIIIESAFLLLILSFPDYMFQRRQHRQSLKMSKQELKEEMKQLEGDPNVRQKLMDRMRELLNVRNIEKNVPLSNVVITNPTHYSVAIMYDTSRMMNAPIVSAKGEDEIALKIREIAKENSIPLVENKPLAQALYKEVNVGTEIPYEYWAPLITILKEVYEISGEMAELRKEYENV
ncbi:MAG: flagellar biosynthesis protein FlhB [Spirochaetaceae bacterium]|nr:flagellar biosynthesis protein FlhB [Spirochaetaceae bacterium]